MVRVSRSTDIGTYPSLMIYWLTAPPSPPPSTLLWWSSPVVVVLLVDMVRRANIHSLESRGGSEWISEEELDNEDIPDVEDLLDMDDLEDMLEEEMDLVGGSRTSRHCPRETESSPLLVER